MVCSSSEPYPCKLVLRRAFKRYRYLYVSDTCGAGSHFCSVTLLYATDAPRLKVTFTGLWRHGDTTTLGRLPERWVNQHMLHQRFNSLDHRL